MLWRAFRVAARGLIQVVPASSEQNKSTATLRAEILKLPSLSSAAAGVWSTHQTSLRDAIRTRDPRAFSTWDPVADTMAPPPYARFVRPELQYLKCHDWRRWPGVLRGTGLFTKTNAIHHAYHLCRFENETGVNVLDFDLILEFGGGYGEMRRVIDRLGFTGRYILFDLPEQSALQRYYLRGAGNPPTATFSDFESVRAAVEAEPRGSRKLFIATWSFDEAPLATRSAFTDLLSSFDAFLLAYQVSFAGIDNQAFFAGWREQFPNLRWKTMRNAYVKDSFYDFGSTSEDCP